MLLAFALALAAPDFNRQPWLPPPPRRWVAESVAPPKAVSIDPLSRSAVAAAYQQVFVPQSSVAPGWTGSTTGCVAGTTAGTYQLAVIERVNFFRALAGLPGVVAVSADATIRGNAQQAALMMSAQGQLSHSPGTSWACYSAGGAGGSGGAASANLALGVAGTAAINLYIDDPGSGNAFVGHRRWILFPPQQVMATGDIPSGTRSNALWVFGPSGPRPSTPEGVAWPPRGFVPYQVLPASSNRWSLSLRNANFSTALVSMSWNGSPITVSYDSRTNNGYGDNTLVWRPAIGSNAMVYGSAGANRSYQVNVSGISGSGVPTEVSYSVTVIDGLETVSPPAPPPPAVGFYRAGFED